MRKVKLLIGLMLLATFSYSQTAEYYYNKGKDFKKHENIDSSLYYLSKAIEINPEDGISYHNRGLSKIGIGQKEDGCLDLSKAGELGIAKAYEAIQKFCQ